MSLAHISRLLICTLLATTFPLLQASCPNRLLVQITDAEPKQVTQDLLYVITLDPAVKMTAHAISYI